MADSNLGTLVTFFTADMSGLIQAQKAAQREMESFRGTASRIATQVGKDMTRLGKSLTLGVTLPIIGMGAAMIKAAIDAEETANKFGVTFSSISKDANAAAKELRNSFGLSSQESQKLLADTGDLLSGFGFTQQAALDLSTEVNKLAVDLASFTNIEGGAQRASSALTKALLGERESVKELGIAILESDVKARVLQLTQQGMTFDTERQAKAFATLQIATEQSKNAVGDYARSNASAANQIRDLIRDVKDIAVNFGRVLLPATKQLVGIFRTWTERLLALDPVTQQMIVSVGLMAAAVGPLVIVIGLLTTAVGILLTPFGLVVAAVVAAGAVFFAFKEQIMNVANFFGSAVRFMIDRAKELKILSIAADLIGKSWVALKTTFFVVVSGIQQIIGKLASSISGLLRGVVTAFEFFGREVPASVRNAINVLDSFSGTMDDMSQQSFTRAQETADNWNNAFDLLKTDLATLKDTAGGAFDGVVEAAKSRLEQLRGLFKGVLGDPTEGMPGGIQPGGPGSPEEAEMLQKSITAWDEWLIAQKATAENIRQFWGETWVDMAEGFSAGIANMVTEGESFASVMKSLFKSIINTIIQQLVRWTIATIFGGQQRVAATAAETSAVVALKQTQTAANAAAAAPFPWMVAPFIAIALAAFASGVGGGGGGGGGGALPAQAEQAPVAQISASSVVPATQIEEGDGGRDRQDEVTLVLTDEFGNIAARGVVNATVLGRGNDVTRLALIEETET